LDSRAPTTTPDEHTIRVQQLFVAHQNAIRAMVLAIVPDFAAADDIIQEVFLVVTRKAADFREGSNFLAWACAIARLKVLEWRRQHPAGMLSEDVIETLMAEAPYHAASAERSQALVRCLERLAPRALELVRLRYYCGHAPREIARLLGLAPQAVHVALSKARSFLRDCVDRATRFAEERT